MSKYRSRAESSALGPSRETETLKSAIGNGSNSNEPDSTNGSSMLLFRHGADLIHYLLGLQHVDMDLSHHLTVL